MKKGLEALKLFLDDVENCIQSGGIHYIDRKNVDIIKKELKALEIIREKGLYWSIQCQSYPYEEEPDYRAWDSELYQSVKLTKEEYQILKEVLSCKN